VDVGRAQGLDEFVETTDLVLDEDGELSDRSVVGFSGGF
jgi:hypothetical protein